MSQNVKEQPQTSLTQPSRSSSGKKESWDAPADAYHESCQSCSWQGQDGGFEKETGAGYFWEG